MSDDNYLRDRTGRITGRFARNWLRDGTGKLVARYNASDDRTRTREGNVVGDGDQRLRKLREREDRK
jgi:hypothetical protein